MNIPPPPIWAERLLRWVCDPDHYQDLLGDLHEVYLQRAAKQGIATAGRRFVWDVLRCFRPSLMRSPHLQLPSLMFRHYLLIAWRHVLRQRAFSLINLLGLSVGLTCTFLIALWVQDELRYDQFHEKKAHIYGMISHLTFGGNVESWYLTPLAMGDEVAPDVPEIKAMTFHGWEEPRLFTYGDRSLQRDGFYASENIFEHFSYPLLVGNPKTVLANPSNVVIDEFMARQLLGVDDLQQAIGKTVTLNHQKDYQVTGVMAEVPRHSTAQFRWVLPMADMVAENPWQMHWGNFNFTGYALLTPGADPKAVQGKIKQVIEEKAGVDYVDIELQNIQDRYLYGSFESGENTGGRISYVRIFSLTALFLLLIACINFMNLATARSSQRAREVGVRKVIGASRSALMVQFYGEAFLMATMALLLAVIATEALLPSFNMLTEKSLSLPLTAGGIWLTLLGIALAAGFLAGSYPALLLSSFPILSVLRGSKFRLGVGNLTFRRILVVFQFALSILLIASTLVIYQQIDFIQNKNLGLDKSHVLSFSLPEYSTQKMDRVRGMLASEPGVQAITVSDHNPINVANSTTSVSWDGKAEDEEPVFHAVRVGYDFLETFHITPIAGRDFDPGIAGDSAGYLINETSMRTMGWERPEEAIGQSVELWGNKARVIGVIPDFHIASLYTPIEPLILTLSREYGNRYVFIRLAPEQINPSIAAVEDVYRELAPDYPFEYSFLDQRFDKMYASETVMSKLATLAAGLGIFIACLGLLGLAAFSAEQRTRELSIRKVLGASIPQLLVLMGREFTLLVILSFALATPIAVWLLEDWLAQFAYRIPLSSGVFILSGASALLIAWLTIGWQSWRAAQANPADALRAE